MPDTSRRRIREAVVQFLYALGPADELPDAPDSAILSLLLESARDKSTRARARAVVHLQQGREKILTGLPPLLLNLEELDPADGADEMSRDLKSWSEEEEKLRDYLHGLRHELNGNKDVTRLRESMEGANRSNRAARSAATRVSATNPHFPALQQLRDEALVLREQIAPVSERLSLALGDDLTTLPELKSVARAEKDLAHTTSCIECYYHDLRRYLADIDRKLAVVVDNYSPERLDRVDRAILRLGTYELLFDDEVPAAVAINEAIELARAFGTTESPGFVNGVLDRVARNR
ncbi:MAG: transcription antitermination factor NusB [Roseibacillus sp.]